MSKPFFTRSFPDPSKPHSLSDRIALIRNEYCQAAAEVAYEIITILCATVLTSLKFVASPFYLVYYTAQKTGTIPSYAQAVLFSRKSPPQPKSKVLEREVIEFLNRILKTKLNTIQEQRITQILEGGLSPSEENLFIEKLFAQRAFEEPNHSLILNYLLKEGKEALAKEKQASLTPQQRIEEKHQTERECLAGLVRVMRLIDQEEVQQRTTDPKEERYLEERTARIRVELPQLDVDGRLWNRCLNADTLEGATELQQQIDRTIREWSSKQGRAEEAFHPLLNLEYYSLLSQRLSLTVDRLKWATHHEKIGAFNQFVTESVAHLRDTLDERFEASKQALNLPSLEEGEISKFTEKAEAELQRLHKAEIDQANGPNPIKITGDLIRDMYRRILSALDHPDRQALLSIETPSERKERCRSVVTENVFLFCLKQTADGQQLVRLLENTTQSGENLELQRISREAFEKLHTQARPILESKLYTQHAFSTDLQGELETQLLQSMKAQAWELDLSSLYKEFNLNLEFWYQDLQQVWVRHLPAHEKAELRKLCFASRERKMSKLFFAWVLNKTGLPFNRSLSFSHLAIPDQSKEEAKALATLTKYARQTNLKERLAAKSAPVPPVDVFKGALLNAVDLRAPDQIVPEITCELSSFQREASRTLGAPTDILSLMKQQAPFDSDAPTADRVAWVESASINRVYQRYNRGDFILFAAFSNIAGDLTNAISPKTLRVFLNLILSSKITPLEYDNGWRKETLNCYLKFLFTGRHIPYQVNEEERKYLVQMATLAEYPLPELQVVDKASSRESGIVELGEALQKTQLGLEGLEESTLQHSFQTSTLPSNKETRKFIDALRARHGKSLPKHLLGAVMEAYPIDHDQGQQAIARALSYAFRGKPQEQEQWILDILKGFPDVVLNEKTMGIPPRIFLYDRLLALRPDHDEALAAVEAFNKTLIGSNNAAQMLVGFAREIKRLTAVFDRIPTEDHFAELLKAKIGYQQIKKQYYEGKVALEGFLKLAADEAEFTITSSSQAIATYGEGLNWNEVVELLHKTEKPHPNERTFVEKAVEKIFKRQREQGLEVKFASSFYLSFGRSDLDIVSGCVYFDGEQYLELPAHLQNHPHVRSLGVHDLPYVQNDDGSYTHYTMEGYRRVPQVRIALGRDGVTVQRRLNTSLQGEEIIPLQYVPLEQLRAIPAALARRMGVAEFWMGPDQTLYGYTEKGALVFNLDRYQVVRTAHGSFRLSNTLNPPEDHLTAVLAYLKNVISHDEILVRHDQQLIYIPALDLELTFKDDQKWHWSSPKITGMTLDLSQAPSPRTFVLAWDGGGSRSPYELENQLILLRKHLKEAEAIQGPSLQVKEQIVYMRKEIIATEEKLAKLDKRLYVTLPPERVDSSGIKEKLDAQVAALKGLSHAIGVERDPERSQGLQEQYLEEEQRYRALVKSYDTCCTKSAFVTYETSHLEHVKGRDFLGSLFLVHQLARKGEEIDEGAWIEELSAHASHHTFDQETLHYLEAFGHNYSSEGYPLLSLYFQLLLAQHCYLKMNEVAKSLTPDQEQRLQEARDLYALQKGRCTELHNRAAGNGTKIPTPISTLLHQHCPELNGARNPDAQEQVPFPEASASKLQALASQSPLERLGLADAVTCHPKNSVKQIPEEQRKLIKKFRDKSHDQAAGFYIEAYGMFSENLFFREFALKENQALFGLKRTHLHSLFEAFKEKGWIKQRNKQDFYYSLSADEGHHPLISIQNEELYALLANLPISDDDRVKAVKRIRTFFFLVAHASFTFEWNDAASKARFERALGKERERHQKQMLDAKSFLDNYLVKARMSLTELKRKVISGEALEHPEGRTALICYLFHKSEIHHIDNIFKAPQKGERNQIELLSTARQYSIDLLLRPPSNDEEREMQVIQFAFLMFEENYGARCNPMQVKLFSSLMKDKQFEEAIDAMQARMGFGKTALLPLLAIVQLAKEALLPPEERSLIRYVVPKAVLQDNAAAFDERISHIMGTNVIQDREFSRYQIDPANKRRSFEWVLQDLETRLRLYDNARRQGIVLIQPPEIRQSMEAQEKAFGFLAINGNLEEEELALCLQCKQRLGQIRGLKTYTVFDELDATQDFKACEVNFTEGKRLPILPQTIRPLERMIDSISRHRRIERMELAPYILGDLQIMDARGHFATFVTSPDKKVEDIAGLQEALDALEPEQYASIFLLRATLLDPNIFDFIHSKQPNTHFGVRFKLREGKRIYSHDPESGSALLIAVPYEGTNTPKGLSTYDCSEVAALTTLRYYASNETLFEEVHINFLMKQMQRGSIPSILEDIVAAVIDQNGQTFIERLRLLAGLIDAAEIEQGKVAFYQDFLKRPSPEVRAYFGRAVVATQVHTDEARANSNRYEMGTPEDQVRGCSGTVSSTSSYFEKAAIDPAADGMLSIAIMGRANNAPIHVLPKIPDPCDDYLTFILRALLAGAREDTRAIIDAAGLCKSRDGLPETIVERLWTFLMADPKFQGIEGIVYYGKDNVKRLYRGPAHPPIACTTAMELAAREEKKYFSFYGQKNTRGSDIKQANGAHALVTMDENVPNNDAKQAVLRFRDLVQESSGQTFTFATSHQYHERLQHKKPPGSGIDAKDIVTDLRDRELEQEHHDALILFRKELEAHTEQAATYMEHQVFRDVDLTAPGNRDIYLRFLRDRDQVKAMVERSIYELERKYGGALTNVERDRFIRIECAKFQQKIAEIARLAQGSAEALRINLPPLGIEFFTKRIETSKGLFESRFPATEPVKISAVDSGAEAVAMALALAEAEALAEAVAETISEALVDVQDRLPDLRLRMARTPHFETPEAWFTAPTGTPIENDANLRHLIHPELRGQIFLSPHLQERKIISHFALIPEDATKPHIFISQEEADRWLTTYETQKNGYALRDLRADLDQDSPKILNMKEAVLRQTAEIPRSVTTEELRKLNLTNIMARQLLPSLTINGGEHAAIAPLFDLSRFGVVRDSAAPATLSLEKRGEVFTVQGGKTSVSILTENEWLAPLFVGVPADEPGKFRWIQKTFLARSAGLRHRIDELRRKEQALAQRKAELKRLIEDASQFRITADLRQGLEVRDTEFTTGRLAERGIQAPILQTCGRLFLDKMGEIQAAQERCKREGTAEALNALDRLFSTFISQRMRNATQLTTEQVFSEEDWNRFKMDPNTPPFDLAYGRIVFSVHGGRITSQHGAKNCSRLDCNQLFNVTLPVLKTTMDNMSRATRDLPGIEREIEETQREIRELEGKIKPLKEADACIKEMETKVRSIVEHFSLQGIVLVPLGKDFTLFWDRLTFKDLAKAPESKHSLQVTGHFPVYPETLHNMEEYQRRIHSLNGEEEATLKNHKRLRLAVNTLAAQVEPRQTETTWNKQAVKVTS